MQAWRTGRLIKQAGLQLQTKRQADGQVGRQALSRVSMQAEFFAQSWSHISDKHKLDVWCVPEQSQKTDQPIEYSLLQQPATLQYLDGVQLSYLRQDVQMSKVALDSEKYEWHEREAHHRNPKIKTYS